MSTAKKIDTVPPLIVVRYSKDEKNRNKIRKTNVDKNGEPVPRSYFLNLRRCSP
jgi:hypothetical protein